jgi:pyruvate/2-oxoglutarate dehydrogenase complex dihydrolipoamide dehydrogenase (E3) component
MWNAADMVSRMRYAAEYGIDMEVPGCAPGGRHVNGVCFHLPRLKEARDAYVRRLNGIYDRNLRSSGVTLITGRASFIGPRRLRVAVPPPPDAGGAAEAAGDGREIIVEGDHVLIATGSSAWVPPIPGADLPGVITSDGFFQLEQVPRAVAGACGAAQLREGGADGAGQLVGRRRASTRQLGPTTHHPPPALRAAPATLPAVVGGGYIAVEMAGILRALGSEVTLLVRRHDGVLGECVVTGAGARTDRAAYPDGIPCVRGGARGVGGRQAAPAVATS